MPIPKRFHAILMALVMAPAGMAFGYAMGKLLKGSGRDLPLGYGIIPVILLDLLLVLAAHELGHTIAGWLAGFKFQLYAVGPLRIDRTGDKLKISFNSTPSLWGGIAASSPDPDNIPEPKELRKRMLMLVAGGPIASLLGALMALPALALWNTQPAWAAVFMVFAIGSVLIAFVTMLPIGNAGFVNDGARILNLLRGDSAAYRWIAVATLGTIASQTRPALWPQQLVEETTQAIEPTYDGIMAMWFRYSWHLDRKEFNEAKTWLDLALTHVDQWPPAARPIIHSSAADFYSRIQPDIPLARRHLAEAKKPGFMPADAIALTEASVLAAEGDRDHAREKLQAARAILTRTSGSGRESVAELLAELDARV